MTYDGWCCITGIGKQDYKPETSTDFHQKGQKKPEKLGGGGRWKSNTYLTHGVKKVYFFLSIERYVNDLLRPPPFAPPTDDGITNKHF